MRRREFIALVGGAGATGWPRIVRAQQAPKIPLLGILSPSRSEDATPNRVHLKAFVAGLQELGYVDGQNITIERKLSEANADRLREAAAELVKHNVDIIFALSTTAARPAQQVTNVIPIVAFAMADPSMMGWWPVLLGRAGMLQDNFSWPGAGYQEARIAQRSRPATLSRRGPLASACYRACGTDAWYAA